MMMIIDIVFSLSLSSSSLDCEEWNLNRKKKQQLFLAIIQSMILPSMTTNALAILN